MAILSLRLLCKRETDKSPLLMEQVQNPGDREHVIEVRNSTEASSSGSTHDTNVLDSLQREDQSSATTRASGFQNSLSSANGSNSRNSSLIRRGDGHGRRRRNPLNSGLWISVDLVLTVSQIVAATVVLSLSRHEHPRAPLFGWIVCYASGCVATLPLLYWRWLYRNQASEQDSSQSRQGSTQSNRPTSFSTLSIARNSEGEGRPTVTPSRGAQSVGMPNPSWSSRLSFSAIEILCGFFVMVIALVLAITGGVTGKDMDCGGDEKSEPSLNHALGFQHDPMICDLGLQGLKALVEYFKMALDCFFAVWFVVGNVWIFGGHSSSSEAPNLYWLCIVFLTISCIGYAMPFILCATICCCFPCIISVMGFREDLTQNRGATPESINSLPTYKFKMKKTRNGNGREINSGAGEGGVVAAGTEKERVISGEDAVCCICLAKYANNDELRELPCSHFFHKECVDKWLKINALCPLCKAEVGDSI
ncbi:hypothetical protein TEA_005697 [Camellia sinensis var. sinensis]|uniref:RING-type domain-containing protein n=1 Tax=Camellia sinensis var. sinensis TaxID=542762 RepID=A0A4S4DJG0_CAMSN|nr:hypothetical protein TEA_005697 [Camellia sinensis var. sinensis]